MPRDLVPCVGGWSAHGVEALAVRLPEPLRPLADLAYDLWWSWQPHGADPFRAIEASRWEDAQRNPVKLLRDAPRECLEAAAKNPAVLDPMRALLAARERDRARPFVGPRGTSADRPIAFFCAEYGLHPSLPIYSGGLGVLAGDILKAASDAALPMVGVGLYYRRGYFHQRLDRSGWQHEYWLRSTAEELPILLEGDESGARRTVALELRGRRVVAQIWRVRVGRVPLFLLDTDVPENDPTSRFITSTLYVADRSIRIMQYAVLAVGGVRALSAMGVEPSVIHLNEGHAALASLELARTGRARGASFADALAEASRRIVFTTHTPVPAGNEHYDRGEVFDVLTRLPADLDVSEEELLRLGRGDPNDTSQPFGVTELALRTSRTANGVSRKHGETARGMWRHLWPSRGEAEVPIDYVTNGVHLPTWMSPPMRDLFDRRLGAGWESRDERAIGEGIDAIPDEELWAVRSELRRQLVDLVRERSIEDRLARGEPISYVEAAANTFDPNTFTMGFARRVASYKRLQLLVQNPQRAIPLLRGARMQVVLAGKAHPMDDGAKRLVQVILNLRNVDQAGARVAFLEDYDLRSAARIVAGCDLWVNLPRPPMEASGTSGMKAALNGGLNLSVPDGWWYEAARDGENGWSIPSERALDEAAQDARDAEALYDRFEREVVPSFYERDASGIPRGWVRRIKASLRTVIPRFTAARMLSDYAQRIYPVP